MNMYEQNVFSLIWDQIIFVLVYCAVEFFFFKLLSEMPLLDSNASTFSRTMNVSSTTCQIFR